jgi:hypothetical protein
MPKPVPRGHRVPYHRFFLVLLLLIPFLVPRPALAVDKYAAEFLKIGVGARALGMGGAFVSLADDASAAYWNPAGLVQLRSREAMGMHASQFGGVVAHDVLSFVAPMNVDTRRPSALGVTLIRLGVDDIQVTKNAKIGEDANGNPILADSLVETKSAYDLALLLSYGRTLSDHWSGGLNFKLIRQSLVGEGASFGMGMDLGFRFQPNPGLALGLRLADITTTRLYWDTGRRETVAPSIALGAHTTRAIPGLSGSLVLSMTGAYSFEGATEKPDFLAFTVGDVPVTFSPGAEYWYNDTVALRVGSDAGNFTAGAGIRYKQVGADYAYLSHDELESTHRVSALVRF